jgi:hypothetical protein
MLPLARFEGYIALVAMRSNKVMFQEESVAGIHEVWEFDAASPEIA